MPKDGTPKTETQRPLAGTVNLKLDVSATMTIMQPLADDHPCYRLVGLIAAETARIESLIELAIVQLADLGPEEVACFTGQMIGPGPRFQALLKLASMRELDPALLKRIRRADGDHPKHFDGRNRALHDPWYEDGQTGDSHQFRSKPRSKHDFGFRPVTEAEMASTLGSLRKYREEVTSIVSDIWTDLSPHSPKNRECA